MSDEETVVDTSGAADSSESALKKRKVEDAEAGEGLAAPLPSASDSTISASETDVPVPAAAKKSSLPADPEACVIKFLCPEPAV